MTKEKEKFDTNVTDGVSFDQLVKLTRENNGAVKNLIKKMVDDPESEKSKD